MGLFKLKIKPQIPFAPPSGAFLMFPITLKINNPFFMIPCHRIIDFSCFQSPISCCISCCIVVQIVVFASPNLTQIKPRNPRKTLVKQRKNQEMKAFLHSPAWSGWRDLNSLSIPQNPLFYAILFLSCSILCCIISLGQSLCRAFHQSRHLLVYHPGHFLFLFVD